MLQIIMSAVTDAARCFDKLSMTKLVNDFEQVWSAVPTIFPKNLRLKLLCDNFFFTVAG
jgi:hypothetical protein